MAGPPDIVEKRGLPRAVAAASYFLVALPAAAPWAFSQRFVRHHLINAAGLWLAFLATGLSLYYIVAGWPEVVALFTWLMAGEDARVIITVPVLFGGTIVATTWPILLVAQFFGAARAAAAGREVADFPAWAALKIPLMVGGAAALVGAVLGVVMFLSTAAGC